MEASRPMDRVVCGDVGFGKTELAVRAAFKAGDRGPPGGDARAHDRALPAALPHLHRAPRRLPDHGAPALAVLSATRTSRPRSRGCAAGRSTSSSGPIACSSATWSSGTSGLVVIDEEQRFGVLQKERFKELRVAVDVLSLSATPIPRTLHMALAGIRDLSVIQTPPEERQPIKTYVTAREDSLVREVVSRELDPRRPGLLRPQPRADHRSRGRMDAQAGPRGPHRRRAWADARGHARVGDARVRRRRDRCAGLHHHHRVRAGHPQRQHHRHRQRSPARAGPALPAARPRRTGRAARLRLHDVSGRSGPSPRSADKRLDVIGELQDLGAGFKLAMRDLEIRGAGNLLGEEQHGEIAAVGLEMYNQLLAEAVRSFQGRPLPESPAQVTVSLPVAAFLPADYVSGRTAPPALLPGPRRVRQRAGAGAAGPRSRRPIRTNARTDFGTHQLPAGATARRRGRCPRRRDRARPRCCHPPHTRPWARPAERRLAVPRAHGDTFAVAPRRCVADDVDASAS